MKIVIDLQGAQTGSRFRGIGRYSVSLTKAIIRNRKDHEINILLSGMFPETLEELKNEFSELLPSKNIKVWQGVSPTRELDQSNQHRREVSEIIREAYIANLSPDFVIISSLFEGFEDNAIGSVNRFNTSFKTAIIFYDLIPFIYQDKYLVDEGYKKHYMRKIDNVKKSDLLLSISNSSASEAIKYLNYDENNIHNISSAVDESFDTQDINKNEKDQLFKKFNITKKAIVYAPGGFDIRKNFENLIKAYTLLPKDLQEIYQLVIVSKIDEVNKGRLLKLGSEAGIKSGDLIFTGYVSDDELIKFYSLSSLFVFASIHEGFGLPVLEAMNCGAVVIGANRTSVPEVIGLEEALFDPYSVDSMSQKISEALTDDAFRERLLKHSKKQIKEFSWDQSAIAAIDALEKQNIERKPVNSFNNLISDVATVLDRYQVYDDDNILDISKVIDKNRENLRGQTVWIDITHIRIHDLGTGIQRVVRSVVEQIYEMKDLECEIKLIYLENGADFNREYGWVYRYAYDFSKKFGVDLCEENYIVTPNKGDIYLGLDLVSQVIEAEKEDQLLSAWKEKGVNINFVVYDILPLFHPYWWRDGASLIHEAWTKTVLKVSDKLVCISQAVVNDMKKWVKENDIEVSNTLEYDWFHLGADIDNSKPSNGLPDNAKEVLSSIENHTSFIMVGTLEPRKGHMQVLKAFDSLWAEGYDIVLTIVGKNGWLVDDLIEAISSHEELGKRLFWLEGVSDEYLQKAYGTSDCLMAASEGEGYGLPLIEAAQHAKSIIARDIPVFREVAGEFAFYFENDNDPSVIADCIKKWITLYDEDNHPKSLEMPWLTWRESTEQLLNKTLR